MPSIVSLICAIAAGIQVWKLLGDGAKHVAHYAALGAVVCGGVGFVGGFFGPMIFAPGANQGPLLGLFITGPLGFLLGGVAGTLYGLVKRRSMAAD